MAARMLVRRGWVLGLLLALVAAPRGGVVKAADTPALAAQVEIRRTAYGVPHIKGDSLEAVAFGFGYCQAEDHLDDVMRGILGARAELAAHFGPGKNGDNVEADFNTRHYRVYRRAVDSYHKLDDDYRTMCEAFAAGLNYYVERHRAAVPQWVPVATGHDVAAYGLAGIMRFAFDRSSLLKDFYKAQGIKTALHDDRLDEHLNGSNMWALAPSRGTSGRAMLLGNPHQPWTPVATYYEAHLTVPGRLNFYGSTFIGRPVLTSGFNEQLGWSHTVNNPDLEEIYELDLDPARADHYRFDGGSVPLEREEVEIAVLGDDGGKTSQRRTFWHAPLGPVIHRTADKVYVLRSACYENYRAYAQWLRMSQTKSFAEFRGLLEDNAIPMFNICYADRVGNIFYLWNGTVPILPHGSHKAEAVHASRTSDVWTRFHKMEDLPQLFNPPGGYVQNCNSPPYLGNLSAPLDPARYPAYFPANNLSLRTQHSLRLVSGDQKLSLEDVVRLKHSPLMLLAERVKDDLLAAVRKLPSTSELEAAVKAIESWDGTVSADSRGGTLFADWWDRYEAKGVGKFAVPWSAEQPTATPRGLADPERAAEKFVEAVRDINSRYGRPDVTWGDVHRIRKGDVDLPVTGGDGLMGCFRVVDFRDADDGKLVAKRGDSFVFAVEFSDPPRAYTIVSYSESGVEGAPHYSDQAPLFSANRMKRAAFTESEIAAQLEKSYRPGEE